MKKKNNKYLILIILVIGIGFAYITTNLEIFGNNIFGRGTFNVYFDNLSTEKGDMFETTTPQITDRVNINYAVSFEIPSDEHIIAVDVVNDSSTKVDATIVSKTNLTEEQLKYIEYSVTYENNMPVEDDDTIDANSSVRYYIRTAYKYDISEDIYETDRESINFSFTVEYKIHDSKKVAKDTPVCVRANNLHAETCEWKPDNDPNNDGCYEQGYHENGVYGTRQIVYGSLGTKGELNTGDAFNCDVNNDGYYDEETERFYYLTDTDSGRALMMFYSNIKQGVPNEKYGKRYSEDETFDGPSRALEDMPTTAQWPNVSLENTLRDIKDETGTVRLSNFSYAGRAARLVSIDEISKGCNVVIGEDTPVYGEAAVCLFLLENTNFSKKRSDTTGWWLENISSNLEEAWRVGGDSRRFNTSNKTHSTRGPRPVIEVPIEKIRY